MTGKNTQIHGKKNNKNRCIIGTFDENQMQRKQIIWNWLI